MLGILLQMRHVKKKTGPLMRRLNNQNQPQMTLLLELNGKYIKSYYNCVSREIGKYFQLNKNKTQHIEMYRIQLKQCLHANL